MTRDKKKKELIERILQHADETFREWLPRMPKELLNLNLTMPQFKIVLLLSMEGSLRMSRIASQLGVSLATATGIVDRLVDHQLVIREAEPHDRRVVLCHLSNKGEEMVSGIWKVASDNIRELLLATDETQLELIENVILALRETVRTAKLNLNNNQSTAQSMATQQR